MTQHRQPAATTVAFALLAPMIFVVLMGAMEGGRIFNAWLVITNEAREAARYGAVRYNAAGDLDAQKAEVTTYIKQRLSGTLAQSGLYKEPDVFLVNQKVDVTIYYQVPLVVPLVSQVLPNPFHLKAHSIMRGE